jgi:hypothetical protein
VVSQRVILYIHLKKTFLGILPTHTTPLTHQVKMNINNKFVIQKGIMTLVISYLMV